MSANKLLRGFRNVHFAKETSSGFGVPKRIHNGRSIETKLNYETEQEWADDSIVDNTSTFAGGEGKLNVLGLTIEEFSELFGALVVKGGVVVTDHDIAPKGAFLFEKQRKNSTNRRLYVIYNCQCAPGNITAETINEGKGQATEDEITFSVGSLPGTGYVYFFVDTEDSTVDAQQVAKWFTEVQMPTSLTPVSNVGISKAAKKKDTKRNNGKEINKSESLNLEKEEIISE